MFEEQLITLICAAKERDIEFIYAISPGLDITFSNPKEVAALKRKLSQVILHDFRHAQSLTDKDFISLITKMHLRLIKKITVRVSVSLSS